MDKIILNILIQTVMKSSHLYNKLAGNNNVRKNIIGCTEGLNDHQNDSSDCQYNQKSILAVSASL